MILLRLCLEITTLQPRGENSQPFLLLIGTLNPETLIFCFPFIEMTAFQEV